MQRFLMRFRLSIWIILFVIFLASGIGCSAYNKKSLLDYDYPYTDYYNYYPGYPYYYPYYSNYNYPYSDFYSPYPYYYPSPYYYPY
ncbi:MAG: hypothetical protein ACE5EA_02555 [Nitrospirota bacterium]